MPVCPTCERDCPKDYMSDHHLRTRGADKHLTELMCRDCHKYVHALFTNKELAGPGNNLDSVEGLLDNPEYAKAIAFIKKLPPGRKVQIRSSKRKKGRR